MRIKFGRFVGWVKVGSNLRGRFLELGFLLIRSTVVVYVSVNDGL